MPHPSAPPAAAGSADSTTARSPCNTGLIPRADSSEASTRRRRTAYAPAAAIPTIAITMPATATLPEVVRIEPSSSVAPRTSSGSGVEE